MTTASMFYPLQSFADAVRVYDVGDYVQNGLVGHFDAIRNAGAEAAHDLNATTWKNLAGGPDAEFQYRSGSTPDSGWTDTSYFFKEDAMATTLDTFDLGTNFTVQIAITADPAAQTTSTVGGNQDASSYNAWFNDNPKNDYGFWTSKAGASLVGNFNKLKTAPSGNVRPTISNWGGEYVTWMLDGANGKCWTFETDTIPNGTSLTVVSEKPAARKYCWGAEYNADKGVLQAFLTGEYHSVRLYNRTLSEKEIVWNRKVDEARYRGESLQDTASVNVVLVSDTFAGDCAEDWMGSYIVSGTQTFTAPQQIATAIDTAFACTGYTLETWNGSAWSAAKTHVGERSYTYDSTSGAKVRVTWHWRVRNALHVYDVDDYVQKGLVAHFDGIRNAGADAAHSMDATTWKNLAGGPDATITYVGTAKWSDDGKGFYFPNQTGCCAQLDDELTLGPNMTIQVAGDFDTETGGRYKAWFFGKDPDFGVYVESKSLKFKHEDTYSSVGSRHIIASASGDYATAILAADRSYLIQGTTLGAGYARTAGTPAAQRFTWGGYPDQSNRNLLGTYYSLRVYDRPLSEAELVQNRIVDEARFRDGVTGGVIPAANVIVASQFPAASAADECGKYVAQAGYEFKADASVCANGTVYSLDGYTLETWDADAGEWGEAVAHDGESSYTATGAGLVRLTWLWSRPLRSIADYDVGDYVQDGLAGHFDAIRNVGSTDAHDSNAAIWKNLAGGPDAEFQYRSGSVPNSGWTDMSYYFKEDAMATTLDTIDLGTNFTVQIAITASPAAQTRSTIGGSQDESSYNAWFNDNPKNDNGFWTLGTGANLIGNFNKLKTAPPGNVRPTISNWGGEYVTWMLDGANGKCWTFETDTVPSGTSLTVVSEKPDARKYCWGAEYNADKDVLQAFLTGEYHSVRLYDRVLSDLEIKQNRRVDEARYRGKGDVTVVNGVVGDTGTNGESSLPDGVYNLEADSWTFTAQSVVVDGRRYQPRLSVEEKQNGEWTAVSAQWVDSYTVGKANLANPVRLTWTWEKRVGMMLIVR